MRVLKIGEEVKINSWHGLDESTKKHMAIHVSTCTFLSATRIKRFIYTACFQVVFRPVGGRTIVANVGWDIWQNPRNLAMCFKVSITLQNIWLKKSDAHRWGKILGESIIRKDSLIRRTAKAYYRGQCLKETSQLNLL